MAEGKLPGLSRLREQAISMPAHVRRFAGG
jgi:hypothetical protein